MVFVNTNDLKHILDQIFIAEQHAAGTPLTDLVLNPLLPNGLRLVDGTLNNLMPGRETNGAADQVMPRLLDSTFLTNPAAAHLADPNPRAPQAGPTSYLQTSGSVYDADPRIISNLVADQTLANPAAIAAALSHLGMTGQAMLTTANEISAAYTAMVAAQEATTNFGSGPTVLTLRSTTDIAIIAPVLEAFTEDNADLSVHYEQWGSNALYEASKEACLTDTSPADAVFSSAVHQMLDLVNRACAARYVSDLTTALPRRADGGTSCGG